MKRPILLAALLAAAALAAAPAAAAQGVIPIPAAEIPARGVCRIDGPITYTLHAPRGDGAAMSELGA